MKTTRSTLISTIRQWRKAYLTYHRSPVFAARRSIRNQLALRGKETVAYICSDPSNTGDYASCLGVRQLARLNGVELYCNNAVSRLTSAPGNGKKWKVAIVGGGGLLQPAFEGFWDEILHADVPVLAFGIGINTLPPQRPVVSSRIIKLLSERAIATHVRDQFTFDAFERAGCYNVTMGPCPSINFLRTATRALQRSNKTLLHVVHPVDLQFSGVFLDDMRRRLLTVAEDMGLAYVEIDHLRGFSRSILYAYSNAAVVVSSRLHGCIFSYAMEKPFIAIECDTKTRAFVSSYVPNNAIIPASEVEAQLSAHFVWSAVEAGPAVVNNDELWENQARMNQILRSIGIR